jgi:hypothetical protein
MEVIVRPLLRNAMPGVRGRYKNCFDWVGPYYSRSGNLYSGLTEEDIDLKLPVGTTAARLEQSLQKGIGSLSPYSDYWKTFHIRFDNKDLVLDTDIPDDELKYIFLKHHKSVANGFSDKTKPMADYIIINKENEAQEANKHGQLRRKAMKEFDKLSLTDMRKLLRLYGHRSDNISSELVENKLFEIIEKDPKKFFDKWVDNKRRETEFLITDGVAKNVIRKNKSEYKYGVDTLGMSIDDAINYLDAPEHRDLKAVIINEISTKE